MNRILSALWRIGDLVAFALGAIALIAGLPLVLLVEWLDERESRRRDK